LAKFLPWVPLIKEADDSYNYIEDAIEKWENGTTFDLSLFNHEGTYLGNIGVHSINWDSSCCEIGYWILGEHEGQGYISDAVKLLEEYLFKVGFNRVEIRCSDLNEKSAGVPKRLGYTLEGILRKDSFEMGAFRNTQIYSKLQSEYEEFAVEC